MLLEYNYDNGNKILEAFKNSELATLNINTVKTKDSDDKVKFVMEYTLIKDYPEERQAAIRDILANSLSERLQLVNVLNKFIENQILDNVNSFNVKFNTVKVRKCEIFYSFSFGNKVGISSNQGETSNIKDLITCLEKFDHIATEMGIANQSTENIYRKEGTGRSKKYVPLTFKEVNDILRQSLGED